MSPQPDRAVPIVGSGPNSRQMVSLSLTLGQRCRRPFEPALQPRMARPLIPSTADPQRAQHLGDDRPVPAHPRLMRRSPGKRQRNSGSPRVPPDRGAPSRCPIHRQQWASSRRKARDAAERHWGGGGWLAGDLLLNRSCNEIDLRPACAQAIILAFPLPRRHDDRQRYCSRSVVIGRHCPRGRILER